MLPTCFIYLIPDFLVSCLKPRYFHHFSAISSSQQIGCFILGFQHGFEFCIISPDLCWEISVWAAWNMPDGAVSVQVHKHQPVTVEQWEPRWWPLQLWRRGENSWKTQKFYVYIYYMRKTRKNLKVWECLHCLHLHREEVAKVIWVPMICYEDWRCLGQCLNFNLSANVERCFTAHFALRSFEGADSWTGWKRVYQRWWRLPSCAI